jgi:Uma2 family endonuclease
MTRFMAKLKDFAEMGVPTCWIIDPVTRRAWIAITGIIAEATDGILRAADLEMPLTEIPDSASAMLTGR